MGMPCGHARYTTLRAMPKLVTLVLVQAPYGAYNSRQCIILVSYLPEEFAGQRTPQLRSSADG